jgi:hypothetical protein
MQTPAASFTTPSPSPQIVSDKIRKVTYEEVVAAAKLSVLDDFRRQQQYRAKVHRLRETGEGVSLIRHSETEAALTKDATNRLLMEHSSISWSMYFFQWSVFGSFSITSVASVASLYLSVFHNRMFFPFVPLCGVIAYKSWDVLEGVWEQQRFIENANQIRNKRMGNPLTMIKNTTPQQVAATQDEEDGD